MAKKACEQNGYDLDDNIEEFFTTHRKTHNAGVFDVYTKEMNKDYTILCPQMAPIHFELIEAAGRAAGYNVELLRECTPHTVETGLKYVNNDACYPSILTTGQFIEALESGKYDVNKTAIISNPNILLDGFNPFVFFNTNFL